MLRKYDALSHLAGMGPLRGAALFSVRGKTAVVTGGSRGIGLMMCRALVENGATVFVVSRKEAACAAAAEALNSLPTRHLQGRAVSQPCDVSTDAGCRALAAAVEGAGFDRVDVLINNAGITWGGEFDAFGGEDDGKSAWDKVFRLNGTAIFNLTRAFRPLLRRASRGNLDPSHVINVSSVAGNLNSSFAFDNAPSYAASKAAANRITQSLAAYLVDEAINVNGIAPAVFPSKMTYSYQLRTEAGAAASRESHPVGRFGNAQDIAGLTLFLSSKASAFVTGSIIKLDGGMSAIRTRM